MPRDRLEIDYSSTNRAHVDLIRNDAQRSLTMSLRRRNDRLVHDMTHSTGRRAFAAGLGFVTVVAAVLAGLNLPG